MTIGLDFDGVLCRIVRWPNWLIRLLGPWLFLLCPAVKGLRKVRRLALCHRLVVVSSRTENCLRVSRLWLWLYRVPAAAVYCVGKQDKVPVLVAEQVDVFFDDKPRYVEAARSREITAHLFESWNQVAALLGPEGEKP